MNETYGSRLKRLRIASGKSAVDLAKATGITKQAWYAIERGESGQFAGGNLVRAAAALNVTEREITDGAQAARRTVATHATVILQYNTGGKMGHGLILRDQPGIINAWHVSSEWLRQNVPTHTGVENLCIVTGFGPSMMPMFNPGDPLLIDRGVTSIEFDGVYFFRLGNEGFIKLVQRVPHDGAIRLRAKSKNPDYDPFWIDETMEFEVFGRVLRVWRGENA